MAVHSINKTAGSMEETVDMSTHSMEEMADSCYSMEETADSMPFSSLAARPTFSPGKIEKRKSKEREGLFHEIGFELTNHLALSKILLVIMS